ncbi:MAG: hypothetical protein JWL75_545 [Parcubacteria group bacterium]|nr:hypothetical protein [Parcubacteria group bacterium]
MPLPATRRPASISGAVSNSHPTSSSITTDGSSFVGRRTWAVRSPFGSGWSIRGTRSGPKTNSTSARTRPHISNSNLPRCQMLRNVHVCTSRRIRTLLLSQRLLHRNDVPSLSRTRSCAPISTTEPANPFREGGLFAYLAWYCRYRLDLV